MFMMPLGAKLGISDQKFSLIYTLFDNYPHVCHHKKLANPASRQGQGRMDSTAQIFIPLCLKGFFEKEGNDFHEGS